MHVLSRLLNAVVRKMASNKFSLIWVVLFLCMLGFSAKAIARNNVGASEMYASK